MGFGGLVQRGFASPMSTVRAGDDVGFNNQVIDWSSLVVHEYVHAGVWVFHVVCYQQSCNQISLGVVMFFCFKVPIDFQYPDLNVV